MTGLPRRHWLVAVLLAVGLVLRLLAQIAYRPALLYIDTPKYLYNSYPGSDPVGYKAPLKLLLPLGGLGTVTAFQHLLGLAIAVTGYVILIRRGSPRWLAALAVAPVLLDAYQIQIEQTIMPDIWFEALIVAGIAILLSRSEIGITPRAIILAGLVLGVSATFRQVGEILLLPALLYLFAADGGSRTVLTRSAVFTVAFAIPIGAYMTGSYILTGHFWLASATPSLSSYGRMATAADCATLRIPAYQRPLCPTARERAFGIDWLDHDAHSPLKAYVAPADVNRYAAIASFNRAVALQQPQRVLAAIAGDSLKLFALTRTSSQGGTPISRWQFQTFYPVYPSWVTVGSGRTVVLGVHPLPGTGPLVMQRLAPALGGKAEVSKPVAAFLRGYQSHGGYTPGPLMAIFTLAGLCGALLALARRRSRRRSGGSGDPAMAALLFFGCGAAVLAMSDAFQFSWRYQLPGFVTLPQAGALGAAAVLSYLAKRGHAGAAQPADQQAELATPAV